MRGQIILSTWLFGLTALSAIGQTQKFATQYSLDSDAIPAAVRQPGRNAPWRGTEPGPVADLKVFTREHPGVLWMGGSEGAARFDPGAEHRWDRWQYFHGRRWLPDNHVQDIYLEELAPHRRVWIRTRTGVSLIEWRPMSLPEKAAHYEQKIEQRQLRHGFVSGVHLRIPDDLDSSINVHSDNDGLWTAMYLGSHAYHFSVTGDLAARNRTRRSLQALMRLESITGVPGFYARSLVSKSEPLPGSGEWHPTPDGKWHWKGDTSSDESVGHYYAYALNFDLVADDAEKAEIGKVVARMADYLIQNDYDMLDLDGKPTRWGRWFEHYYKPRRANTRRHSTPWSCCHS